MFSNFFKTAPKLSVFSTDLKKDVLYSSIAFVKSESIEKDVPLLCYEVDPTGANVWTQLKTNIKESPALVVAGLRADLMEIIDVLQEVGQSLNLTKMRGFQIYKYPLCIAKVTFIGDAHYERYGYIEMNEYRKSLVAMSNIQTDSVPELITQSCIPLLVTLIIFMLILSPVALVKRII